MVNGSAAGQGNFVDERRGFLTPSTARRALTRVFVHRKRIFGVEPTIEVGEGSSGTRILGEQTFAVAIEADN